MLRAWLPVNRDLRPLLEAGVPTLYVVWMRTDPELEDVVERNYGRAAAFESWIVYARKRSRD